VSRSTCDTSASARHRTGGRQIRDSGDPSVNPVGGEVPYLTGQGQGQGEGQGEGEGQGQGEGQGEGRCLG
jgi:hypothetical protein